MNLLYVPILFTLIFVAAAIYYFISRDTEQYRRSVEKRMKELAQERGSVSRRDLQVLKDELLSDIPMLHRALIQFEIFTQLQNILKQADVKMVVNRFITISLSLGFLAGTLIFLFSGSLFATVVVTGFVASLPLLIVLQKRKRRFRAFLEQLPDALELMVRSLQAGHSFSSALQMVATEMPDPVAKEFGKAYEEQNLGLNLKNALENLAERVPLLDLKMCVTAVLIQREIGGNLSEVLRNISHTIRERFRIQGEIRVKSAQARLSGYVVSALPFFLFFWINLFNPKYMQSLYEHPWGYIILGTAVGMQIVGWLIIRKIINIEV